jgi:general secretion pathway protein H
LVTVSGAQPVSLPNRKYFSRNVASVATTKCAMQSPVPLSRCLGSAVIPTGPIGDNGFTLIEMLVVIGVLGLIMVLMATSGPKRSHAIDMQAVVQQVAQAARLAHAQAIAGNRVVRMIFDAPGHHLRIDDTQSIALPPAMRVSLTAVSSGSIGGTLTAIRFNPDGSATGGRIELADGSRHALVGVDWLTGRVSVVESQ